MLTPKYVVGDVKLCVNVLANASGTAIRQHSGWLADDTVDVSASVGFLDGKGTYHLSSTPSTSVKKVF